MKGPPGMTLMEMLVAMVVLAIMSGLAYGGLQGILLQKEVVTTQSQRLTQLQTALWFLQRDLQQLVPTFTPLTGEGTQLSMLRGDNEQPLRLAFVRGGFPALPGTPPSSLRTISYRFAQGTLWRDTRQSAPHSTPVLDHLALFRVEFFDHDLIPHNAWPQPSLKDTLPLAIRITMRQEGEQDISRLFSLPR